MRDYNWIPWQQRLEERVMAGMFFLALMGAIAIIVGFFKWVVNLF